MVTSAFALMAGMVFCVFGIYVCVIALRSILGDAMSLERVRRGRLWCYGGVHSWNRLSPDQRVPGNIRKCWNCERIEENEGPAGSVFQQWRKVAELPDARIERQ
jgi:hypothetical protein